MEKIIPPHTYLELRLSQMETERSSWMSHWRELVDNFSPRRGRFDASDKNKGNKRNHLINNTPIFALHTLRAGMTTGLTSPARPWFRLQPPDPAMNEFAPVREWLDAVEKLMYRVFAASNLYKVLPLIYEDAGCVGTAAMIQEEDFHTITRFKAFAVGEYMLDTDGHDRVDTFGRKYQMTVKQVVDRFGYDKASSSTQSNYDSANYLTKVNVRNIIEPVKSYEHETLKLPDDFKFRSVYWEDSQSGSNEFLEVKGYKDLPILAPRWDAKAGDTYSYCPGMTALGDAKSLQVQERESGKAIAKMVSPPIVAPSSAKNARISLLPGAVNFDDDQSKVFRELYHVNVRTGELEDKIQKTERRIDKAMFVDLFFSISNMEGVQPRNIMELAERKEEGLLQLGPVLEGMYDDLIDPLIDRTFNMLVRLSEPGWRGMGPMMLPPPPQELAGQELKVEKISPLAQAQKLVSTGTVERFAGFVGNVANLNPAVLDTVDWDEMVTGMADDLGVPTKITLSDEKIAAIREARAQAEQQQSMQQNADAVVNAAKSLGDTPTTGGNVLNDVLGVGG